MIEMRHGQLSFGDGLIAEEASDLRRGWMTYADEVPAGGAIGSNGETASQLPRPRLRERRLDARMVAIAKHWGVVEGCKMARRYPVLETNVH